MSWKRVSIYVFVVMILAILLLQAIFDPGNSSKYIYQAKENGDLSYCNKISFFKVYYRSTPGFAGPNIAMRTQR